MGLFKRKYAPGLESGMTLKEWDALYGEAAQLKRCARFRRPAVAFGVLLIGTIVSAFSIDSEAVRFWVATMGMIALVGLVFSAAIYFMPKFLDLADPPIVEKPGASGRRSKRRK